MTTDCPTPIPSLYLQVDFRLGIDIREAAVSMTELANRIGVPVSGKFNERLITAYPNGNPMDILNDYSRPRSVKPKLNVDNLPPAPECLRCPRQDTCVEGGC